MKFIYKARNKDGQEQKGEIEASSKKSALELLESHGFYVISLQASGGRLNMSLNITSGVSSKDLVLFTRQFSIMLRSAIPPLEALRAQILQTAKEPFKRKLIRMAEAVETGSSLSRALSLESRIFNPFYISMVKSGEATGKVADSLNYLAEHLEREYNLKHKIQGAMIYPAFIVVAFVGAFFLVTFFIVPRLGQLLSSFEGKLPWTTGLLLSLSDFVRKGGWILVVVILGFLFILPWLLQKTPKTKKMYDQLILKVPILGNFKKKTYLAQFSENLSVLIAAGLPITQAIKITKDIIGNTLYQSILERAEERVSRGEKISAVLSGFPRQFPAFVVQMVYTGEETGRLDDTLMNVVKFYQEEISRIADNLTSILEPVLIVCMGIGIAILAVSLFVPLFQMGLGGV
ncbi:MAG: type II secretion system F family protein [Candidatus Pacebacteria bacterium]|nr:type II secretion system F family protein [Candidatus Paceibacterota bacterium]